MSYQNENLPIELYTAVQVRELDHIAIEDFGIPGYTLMQRAAQFSYDTLVDAWPDANKIVVVCGGGNNAGDGYVLATIAKQHGKHVKVIKLIDPNKLKGDAAKAYQDMVQLGLEPDEFSESALDDPDIVVDAIFGTGLDRNVEGKFKDVIDTINAVQIPVLSIDIPSGLNADTGNIMNVSISSEITTTFIGLKRGLFTANGSECSGLIRFNNLDVPEEIYRNLSDNTISRLSLSEFDSVLEKRHRNSHKGHNGHVLVVGGDHGYLGAARMAAEAAARVGAGLISIATRKDHAAVVSAARPELMSHGVETLDELMPLIKKANVIAIGPGLGKSEWARLLFARVLESSLPLVIDADGLNLLAEDQQYSDRWVLTPHPGEAARLLGSETQTIQSDRFNSIKELHEKYHGPVVLKGSGTLVSDTNGNQFLCDSGNPGMSCGGMGDVLTGVIAGLIAQGININEASKLGVCLHAQAGDKAALIDGERGLMAMDLMPHLRKLVNS